MSAIALKTPVVAGGVTIAVARPLEPIHYSMKWPGVPGVSAQTVTDLEGARRKLFTVFPALRYMTPRLAAGDDLTSWLHGSIVVIGATHRASRDTNATPLGEMPGSFVIINFLRGMLDFGPEREASWLNGLLLTILISLVTVFAIVALEQYLSTWLELVLPVAITAVWWVLLTIMSGSGGYFALALTQFIVVLVVRLVPRETGKGGPKVVP